MKKETLYAVTYTDQDTLEGVFTKKAFAEYLEERNKDRRREYENENATSILDTYTPETESEFTFEEVPHTRLFSNKDLNDQVQNITELMVILTDNWDNEQLENYPKDLPSFDELAYLVSEIKFKPCK